MSVIREAKSQERPSQISLASLANPLTSMGSINGS